MTGKAYTMREMREIIEYLNERKAYGELRGRKMWMEFANSNRTARTWQSLKETFLKRILPDIQNPYYKLTMDEVRSFREGVDVVEKEKKNRLEFRENNDLNGVPKSSEEHNEPSTITKNMPTTSHENQIKHHNEPPTTSIDKQLEKVTGEDIKADKIPSRSRSSADTIVLEYENAEDVQRVLESPNNTTEAKSKSLKDMITFEPLSPFVRDVIHDFESESETSDSEPRLKIAEGLPNNNIGSEAIVENLLEQSKVQNESSKNKDPLNEADSTIEIQDTDTSDSISTQSKKTENDTVAKETSNENQESNIGDQKNKKTNCQGLEHDKNETIQQVDEVLNTESPNKDTDEILREESNSKTCEKLSGTAKNNSIILNTEGSTQSITFDSLLPNNQEALESNSQTGKLNQGATKKVADKAKNEKNRHQKRSSSKDNRSSKKQKLSEFEENATDKAVIEIVDSSPVTINTTANTMKDTFDVNLRQRNDNNAPNPMINKEQDSTVVKDKNPCQLNANLINKEQDITVVEDKNPCLLNVNLFDEQSKNYSDSESGGGAEKNKNEPGTVTKNVSQKRNKVEVSKKDVAVVALDDNENKKVDSNLSSSSDCKSRNEKVVSKNKSISIDNLQRERALANVFGFAHGRSPISNKRRLGHRRSSHHRRRYYSNNTESNSSEWTSQSDSESHISPPRGHRSRQNKKYLKPKSSRILQDPDSGQLYVIIGKKVYPIVEKHIKKFVTYKPDSGSDDEESYWKKKYMEEKKRNEDVKRFLKEAPSGDKAQINDLSSTSQNIHSPRKPAQNENTTNNVLVSDAENKTEANADKIVFKVAAKNGLEYCLEGGWNQISNAMPQVVKLLQYETATDKEKVNSVIGAVVQTKAEVQVAESSGASTPLPVADAEVHEKVDKLETEIFNEIKNMNEQETEDMVKTSVTEITNVTKRKGRPTNAPSLPTAAKRARSSKSKSTDSRQDRPRTRKEVTKKLNLPDDNENEKNNEITRPLAAESGVKEDRNEINKKLSLRNSNSRSSKHRETAKNSLEGDVTPAVTRSAARTLRTPKKNDAEASKIDIGPRQTTSGNVIGLRDSGEDVRYMLPSTNAKKSGEKEHRSAPVINIIPPPEKIENFVDSTYGYHDSVDDTLMKFCVPKRKRKLSVMIRNKYKNKRITRKSCPVLLQTSSDSSSSYFVPLKKSFSSLNSEIHISESYRLLMPKQNPAPKKLESIDESNAVLDDPDVRHFSSISKDLNQPNDIGSSSNVSLPVSPELSMVENMSISREIIKDASHPTINEVQQNVDNQLMDYSEFMISNLDISVPLMDQKCKLQKNTEQANTVPDANKTGSTQITDCTVDITLSETLDKRLRELLLESNKKQNQSNKQTPMDVDQTILTVKKTRTRKQKENTDVEVNAATKNTTKAKKRSSTPQKKKTITKSKVPQNSIIEEEHIESCASGRKSCPPVLTFMSIDENANNNYDITLNPVKTNKKKKDIIKVKILKPKEKKRSKENLRAKSVENGSLASTVTDSGINDTETISVILRDSSVDLIHNHSETCLIANACRESDSVEFIPSFSQSIISLSSSNRSEDSEASLMSDEPVVLFEETSYKQNNIPPDRKISEEVLESPQTKYHSPLGSNSSLITEDLSNSPPTRSTKWYLLDEDVTNMEIPSITGFGSNLRQIFPIACAVPNLSTISETSRENEDSNKASGSLQQRLRNLLKP